MGEIIVRKVRGMNWITKISLVLVFTLVFSIFMYQGWYKPKHSEAAITTLKAWSNIYSSTARPAAAIAYDIPAATYPNSRMLVVAVSSTMTPAATTQTCTVSYGGQSLTAVASNFTTSSRMHTALYYLLDAGIQAATDNQLTVTLSATGTQWTAQVDAAVFEGVNQVAPASSQSWLNNGTASSAVGPFAANLTVGTGELAVEAVAITRTASSTPRTIGTWAANWSAAIGPTTQANGTAASTNFYMAQDSTAGTTTSQHTASNTTNGSMSAMSLGMLAMNLQVGNGTNPANANAGQGTINNPLDSFTMAASAGGVIVNTLTLTGSANFTTANIAGISVYRDSGTLGVLDGTDVLVPSSYSAITANVTTITFTTPEAVGTATENFLITVDMAAAATSGQTFTGRITAATGSIGTPTYGDTNSATLTIQNAPGLTIGDGTNPANDSVGLGTENNVLDRFTLQTTNALGGTAAIDTLRVTGSANFTAANVTDVKVSCDAEGIIPSTATAIAGNVTTLTFPSHIYVTNTAKNCSVLVDIAPGATVGQAFTGVVTTPATGHGLGTPTYSDAGSATLTIKQYAYKVTSCGQCHGYPPADGTRSGATGAVVGDHQVHNFVCSTCHITPATETSADYGHRTGGIQMQASIAGGTYSKASPITQVNNPTTGTCSNISCHGGNNPTPQWGVGTAGCVDCHNGVVTATVAQGLGGPSTRVNVVADFALASKHTRSRTPSTPTNNDCGVCHMEGTAATGAVNPAYHANGYVELRDPDLGTTIQGVTHSGSTSAEGSYSSTGTDARFLQFKRNLGSATLEADTQAIMVNHCLKCHDSGGAGSTLARVPSGTATNPFNATVASMPAGGVLDVNGQFVNTNRSFHPILHRTNNGYTNSNGNRMLAPWNGVTKTGTTTVYGPLMTCWDCHAPNGTGAVTITSSGVHGGTPNSTDNVELRGNVFVNNVTATTPGLNLCVNCHNPAYLGTTVHTTGSAWTSGNNGGMTYTNNRCYYCHSSADTTAKPARPIPAGDVHGFTTYSDNTAIPANDGYAFFRRKTLPHSVRQVGATTYSQNCGNGTGICSQNMGTYTPGGVY